MAGGTGLGGRKNEPILSEISPGILPDNKNAPLEVKPRESLRNTRVTVRNRQTGG